METTIFITNLGKYNEGELIGEQVTLPICENELREVFTRIGINEEYEEYFISDYECEFMEIGEYDNIQDLNDIVEQFENLGEYDKNKVVGMIEAGFYDDVLEAIDNIDNYVLYNDINTEQELGENIFYEFDEHNVPEHLHSYIDFELYGRDYRIQSGGVFTTFGFIVEC